MGRHAGGDGTGSAERPPEELPLSHHTTGCVNRGHIFFLRFEKELAFFMLISVVWRL